MPKKTTYKRRILSLVPALLLSLLCLAACGKGEQPEAEQAVPEAAESEFLGKLRLSEIMYHNSGALMDDEGKFPDWIEIRNLSDESIDLTGFTLSDREGEPKWTFSGGSIEPEGFYLLFCDADSEREDYCNFSLSEDETLYLCDSEGRAVSAVKCEGAGENLSLAADDEGNFHEEKWITPGFENSAEGYEAFCNAQTVDSPIIINEAMPYADKSYGNEGWDWLELKNVSGEAVEMSDYYISDDGNELQKWQLPAGALMPGEYKIIYCSGDESLSEGYKLHCNFSLSSDDEKLFLSDAEGKIADYVHIHDVPANGSMGAMADENGLFYFEAPTLGADNENGKRRISAPPVLLTEDGVFNGVDSVSAELSANGTIYYTTDGSLPTLESEQYTAPVSFESTGVLRAVAVEEGALPSVPVSYSYIMNENHSLPVLSLVTDKPTEFRGMYLDGYKGKSLQANLALYNDPAAFNRRCTVTMKGFTSLGLPKKSMGVSFKGCHGGKLEGDVFGNGITEFSNLAIRAGQDYTFSIFRNELFQELCLQGSENVYAQASKYCVLYVNGEYYGIFCLKEDLNRQFYASHNNVSRSSVESIKFPAPMGCSFWDEVLDYCWNNDMSVDENYAHICEVLDVDSLIDWTIFEGYSANTDVQGNLKVFRSPEAGNKWQFSFYDLDWGFYADDGDFRVLLLDQGNTGYLMPSLIKSLLQNEDFKAQFIARFKELNESVLSNEHVLGEIDRLQNLLDPEVARDRERWDLSYDSWLSEVDKLRSYITDCDREIHNIDQICSLLDIDDAQRQEIFGR